MAKKIENKHTPILEKYEEARKTVSKEFNIDNLMALPRLEKIVVNMGTGDKLRDKNKKEILVNDFSSITGQKPKIQEARISVAGFGIRAGMPVGLTTTLRRDRMYSFLDKLISIVLPRLRDFRGISNTSFDKAGNYTLGLSEHIVFPEIDLAKVEQIHGIEITLVVKNGDREKSFRLLELMGMPFKKDEE